MAGTCEPGWAPFGWLHEPRARCPKPTAVSLSVLIGAVIAALAGRCDCGKSRSAPNRPEADREALWKIVHDRCEFPAIGVPVRTLLHIRG